MNDRIAPRTECHRYVISAFLVPLMLCLVLIVPLAHADTLFAGGERDDFIFSDNSYIYDNTALDYRYTNFSRVAIRVSNNNSLMYTPYFTPSSTIGLHFAMHSEYYSISDMAGRDWIFLYDNNGVLRLSVRFDNTSAKPLISFYKHDSGGTETLLATSTEGLPYNIRDSLNRYVLNIDYSTTGRMEFFQGGTSMGKPVLVYEGDVTTDGETTLARAALKRVCGCSTTSTPYASYFSEVIVADRDAELLRLKTLNPQADHVMDWDGDSSYVKGVSWNNNNVIFTSAANNVAQFAVPAPLNLGLGNRPFAVHSIVQTTRMKKAPSGPQNMRFLLRTGGADYPSADIGLEDWWPDYSYRYTWETNPATGQPWTVDDVEDAGFYLGVESRP